VEDRKCATWVRWEGVWGCHPKLYFFSEARLVKSIVLHMSFDITTKGFPKQHL